MGVFPVNSPKIIGADLSADRVLSAPLGAFSPLWFAFGAAASAGVTYWWMTRWMRPAHLEALAVPALADQAVTKAAAELEAISAPAIEALVSEPAPEPAKIEAEAPALAADIAAPVEAAIEASAEVVEKTADAAEAVVAPPPVAAKAAVAEVSAPMEPAKARPAAKPKAPPVAKAPSVAKAEPSAKAPPAAKSAAVSVPTTRSPRRKPRA